MRKTRRKVAMCLMAHPDDCEFLAAGTLILLSRRGWEIHLATMTPGDCGSTEVGPEEIAAIRRREGAAAAALIGATYHCLESRDLYVTFDEATLRRAMSLTRSIAPQVMFTHSPHCYMMDHVVASQIARSAAFGYPIPNTVPGAVPAGAAVPHLYYAQPVEGIDEYGRPVPSTTVVDITRVMPVKTRMLQKHASQRSWLQRHHGIDEYTRAMKDWSGRAGRPIGVRYAEGFRQHLGHGYPRDCLLGRELGKLVTRPTTT